MAKRWVVGGIWAILVAVEVLTCGPNAVAEPPRTSTKLLISDVIIQGNHRLTIESINAHLHTRPGKEYNPSVVNDDVRELYKTKQFSKIVTFLQEDGPGKVKIHFLLCEVPNKVEKVTFLGAKHIKPDELQNITGVWPGRVLFPNLNQQGCRKIIAKYEEIGRPSAQCTLVKGGDVKDTEVIYQISEGPKVKVRDIQFTGNTFVSSARLATRIQKASSGCPRIGATYNKQMADVDINVLYEYFRDFGYQEVKIALETQRSNDGSEVTLIYHIQEGPRYRVKDVPEVHGTESLPREQLMAQSMLKPGDYLDERKLKKDVKSITDYLGEHGKAVRVEVIPVWSSDQPGVCGIRYEVEEIVYRIRKIRVTGNERISRESILAHVPLVPGRILSRSDLKQAERNLAELGLFVVDAKTGVRPTIAVIDVEDDSDRKDLLITVKEKTKAKSKTAKRP